MNVEINSPIFDALIAKFRFFLRYRVLCVLFVVMFIISSGLMTQLHNTALASYLALETFTFMFILLLFLTFVSDVSLFNNIGDSTMFDQDGNVRMAPVLTADVKSNSDESGGSSDSFRSEDSSLKNMSSSIMRRGSSTSSLTLSPFKRGKKKRKKQKLASVLVVVHPGDSEISVGVESRYTDTFSKRTNTVDE